MLHLPVYMFPFLAEPDSCPATLSDLFESTPHDNNADDKKVDLTGKLCSVNAALYFNSYSFSLRSSFKPIAKRFRNGGALCVQLKRGSFSGTALCSCHGSKSGNEIITRSRSAQVL